VGLFLDARCSRYFHAMVAGGSHIDHADILRSGSTEQVFVYRVMAPSTHGTFLRSFSFGHICQLDKVLAEALHWAWYVGAGSGSSRLRRHEEALQPPDPRHACAHG
jgi:hypothetical protein